MLRPIYPSYTLARIMCVFLCRSALFGEEVFLFHCWFSKPQPPSNNPVTLLTLRTEIAGDHHSNDNSNTAEQTYRLICSSFTFTQTGPCTDRTECFIRSSCVILYEIPYAQLFLQPQLEFNYYRYYCLAKAA